MKNLNYDVLKEYIEHYGIKRRSGRYPWGSGEAPQRSLDILSKNDALKSKGLAEKERAAELGMTIKQLRSQISYANEVRKLILWDTVQSRSDDGSTAAEISRNLGIPEPTVRKYLKMPDPASEAVNKQLISIEKVLKDQIAEKTYLDIGPGVEQQLGVTKSKLEAVVLKMAMDDDYYVHSVYVPQVAGKQGNYTTVLTISKEPDAKTVTFNKDKIRPPEAWSDNGGLDFRVLEKPVKNLKIDKVGIVYNEDGGSDRDGLIAIRRGAKDLDLGASRYAQVRIAVEGSHYLKGMAMYGDDVKFPPGKDVMFFTNKSKDKNWKDVLKEMSEDDDNPFGATIKANGQRGALNIVNEEGDWGEWKSEFSSQFLSKQPYALIKERIGKTVDKKVNALDEIMKLTNPTVKKKLLDEYADQLDSDASSLKLQGISRTRSHVLLPFPSMRPDQVYAPNFKDGDRVVLLRHPHGGTFELPELTVNNKGVVRKLLGNVEDAIGIHPTVAEKMSGADFDGDTVLVIPNNSGKVKTSKTLADLKDFDPHSKYALPKGATVIPKSTQQTQMGVVSNLITDMTLRDAPPQEIARAVKHSMVVIDAKKHKLDYKQSAIDNGISALQRKYQSHVSKVEFDKYSGDMLPGGKKHSWGASTIVSRASKEFKIFDPETGKKKSSSTMMDLVDDAYKLSSGTSKEDAYAGYANKMKKMAIDARKEAETIKPLARDPKATVKYNTEVESLNTKLNIALANAPRERQAQILANTVYAEKTKKFDYDKDQKKKLRTQSLVAARKAVGAKRENVEITDKEWEAIQNKAISADKLASILKYSNPDRVRELATPRSIKEVSPAAKAKASALKARGYTTAQIAESLGISTSTVFELTK